MKKLTLCIVWILTAIVSQASPVDKQQARQQAQAFMQSRGRQIVGEPRRAPGVADTPRQPYYVFNAKDRQGFVVIAGDSRAYQVLGYADEGTYDESLMPENMRNWLQLLADEIAALPDNLSSAAPRQLPAHRAIAPLIRTTWNQGDDTKDVYIYNEQTPTISSKHCLTGCVATAGAQIMYYYQHPKAATAEVPGYKSSLSATQASLPAVTFQWDKMKEHYDDSDALTKSSEAVSQLMKYCGWAAKMSYGLNGSSASEYTLAKGMVDYFDYDPYTWKTVKRAEYSVAQWDQIIYDELAAGRPVIYSGQAWVGDGHAFICDGYDGQGLFHFNWGWGGRYNGYFRLQATNPHAGETDTNDVFKSGYVLDCVAQIGLQPNTGVVPAEENDNDEWESDITAYVFKTSIEGEVISISMGNNNAESYGFDYGLGSLTTAGTFTPLWSANLSGSVLQSHYYYSFTINTASLGLADGSHELYPICRLAGESEWKKCSPAELYYSATVEGSTVSVTKEWKKTLKVSNFACTSTRQPNSSQTVTFDITNTGDNYDGYLTLYASNTSDMGDYKERVPLKIMSGNTKQRTFTFYVDEAGTYNIWICQGKDNENIIAQTTIDIEQNLTAKKFSFDGTKIAKMTQPVVVTVESTGNDFNKPLYLFASTTSSKGSALYCAPTAIEANHTEDVSFFFKPAAAGTYNVWICTDLGGENVVGKGSVSIGKAPTTPVTFDIVSQNVSPYTTATCRLTVKNTSSVVYYEDIILSLYVENPAENNYLWVETKTISMPLIKAGETRELVVELSDLQVGTKYLIYWKYRPLVGDSWQDLVGRLFTVEGLPTAITEAEAGSATGNVWVSLDGRRLTTQPTRPGIYLHNGRKVVVR